MTKKTSMTLGESFDGFIAKQINEGRFVSASEVVRTAQKATGLAICCWSLLCIG